MIDGQDVFNSLPPAVQSKLGATEETYSLLESFANEGLTLLKASDLSDSVQEKLAVIYTRAQAYLRAGYNDMYASLYNDFLRTRKELEKALEEEPQPEPAVFIGSEDEPFDENELEKW